MKYRRRLNSCVLSRLYLITLVCGCLVRPALGADEPGSSGDTFKPIALQEHDSGDVEVGILQVQRTPGDTLTLRWQYQNKSAEEKTVLESDAGLGEFGLAKSAYLIDNSNKKKYFVVEDSNKTPVAAKMGHYGKVTVPASKTVKTWAKFPAPPQGVQRVTVYLPGVAPFEDVPITG